MTNVDYKSLNTTEIDAEVVKLRERLRVFYFEMTGSKNKNVREARIIRRQIAQYLTERSSRLTTSNV